MEELKTTVRCNKTLFHTDGTESFTKAHELLNGFNDLNKCY